MAIEAELDDGTILEFPDGTDKQVIGRTVKNRLGLGGPATEPAPSAAEIATASAPARAIRPVAPKRADVPAPTSVMDGFVAKPQPAPAAPVTFSESIKAPVQPAPPAPVDTAALERATGPLPLTAPTNEEIGTRALRTPVTEEERPQAPAIASFKAAPAIAVAATGKAMADTPRALLNMDGRLVRLEKLRGEVANLEASGQAYTPPDYNGLAENTGTQRGIYTGHAAGSYQSELAELDRQISSLRAQVGVKADVSEQFQRDIVDATPKNQGFGGKVITSVAGSLPSTLAGVATGVAAGPLAGAAVMGMPVFGNTYAETMAHGDRAREIAPAFRALDNNVAREQFIDQILADKYADTPFATDAARVKQTLGDIDARLGTGLISQNTARQMKERAFGTFSRNMDRIATNANAGSAFWGGVIDAVAEVVGENLSLGIALKAGTPAFTRLLHTMTAEAGQEAATQIMQSLNQVLRYDPTMTLKQGLEQVAIAAASGAVMGGGMAVPGAMIEAGRNKDASITPGTRGDLAAIMADPRPLGEIRTEQAKEAVKQAAPVVQAKAQEAVEQKTVETHAQDVGAAASGIPARGERATVTWPDGEQQTVTVRESYARGAQVELEDGQVMDLTDKDVTFGPGPLGDGSRESPVVVEHHEHAAQAGQRVDVDATDAMKDAGNYRKGHVEFQGMDVTIENPKGSVRRSTDPEHPWEVDMPAHYGYIKRTVGADDEQVDVYLGDNVNSPHVFVVDQIDPATGKFDEHKVMLGFTTKQHATATYHTAFNDGSGASRIGAITQMSVPAFKAWLKMEKGKRPIAYKQKQSSGNPGQLNEKPVTGIPATEQNQPVVETTNVIRAVPEGQQQAPAVVEQRPAEARPQERPVNETRPASAPQPVQPQESSGSPGPASDGGGRNEPVRGEGADAERPIPANPVAFKPTYTDVHAGLTPAGERENVSLPKLGKGKGWRGVNSADIHLQQYSNGKWASSWSYDLAAQGFGASPVGQDAKYDTRDEALTAALAKAMDEVDFKMRGDTGRDPAEAKHLAYIRRWLMSLQRGPEAPAKKPVTPQLPPAGGGTGYVLPTFASTPAQRTPKAKGPTMEKAPPGGWKDSDKVPSARPATGGEPIGKNADGNEVFKDARGVRSIVVDGVRVSEAVELVPTRGEGGKVVYQVRPSAEDPRFEVAPAKPDIHEAPSDFATGLRAKSYPNGNSSSVMLGNGKFVPLADAVAAARATVESGVRPVQFQILSALDLAGRDIQRVLDAMKEPAPSTFGATNKVFTEDKAAAARALLKKKLGSVNTGLDPEVVQAGIQLAGYYIEGGARSFAAYSEKMIADLGEIVRPYLKGWYAAIYYGPEIEKTDMDEPGSIKDAAAPQTRNLPVPVQKPAVERAKQSAEWLVPVDNDDEALAAELKRYGEEPASRMDAERRFAAGERLFVAHPQDEQPMEVKSVLGLEGYAPDEMLALPKTVEGEVVGNEQLEEPNVPNAAGQGGADGSRAPALEGVPAEKISAPAVDAPTGQRTGERGGPDATGDGNRPAGGVQPIRGVGEKPGPVAAPAGGTKPGGRAGADEPTVRSPGGEESDVRPDDVTPPLPGEVIPQPHNFVITDELELGKGGPVQKYNGNIAAIKLLKTLELEGRNATPEEQKVLARYVGWGGIKQVFPAPNARPALNWAGRVEFVKNLLTPEEHAAAARSIQDAHYTSKAVVDAMWNAVRRLGFSGGKVIENSMGVGNFFGLMPADLRVGATLTGIELDSITSRIARQLYPNARIMGPVGFHEVELGDNTFNLTIGNPPFGAQSLYDPTAKHFKGWSIHNFFFGKAIDKLAPGGIHIQVVSRYLMDADTSTTREYLAHRTRLLGAIRLPWTAFYENANTEVVTDIIVLQKLPESEWGTADQTWVGTTMIPDPLGGIDMRVNAYYHKHRMMILGTMNRSGEMLHDNDITVQPIEGSTLEAQLADAIEELPADVYTRGKPPEVVKAEEHAAVAPQDVIENYGIGQYFEEGGKLFQRNMTQDGSLEAAEIHAGTPYSEKQAWGDTKIARLRGMIDIRETERALLRAESKDAPKLEMEMLRTQLNEKYDLFVAEHGFLNESSNEQVFRADPDAPLLLALENKFDRGVSAARAKTLGVKARKPTADKMPIFTQRVVRPHVVPTKADSIADAMAISIQERGSIIVPYIAGLTGKGEKEVTEELTQGDRPLAYYDPATQTYETASFYLSGNVKRKYKQAKDAGLLDQAAHLKAVFPPDVKAGDIRARIGSPWINRDVYELFVQHLLGEEAEAHIQFVPATGGWAISTHGGDPVMVNTKWGTHERSAHDLIARILNNRDVTVSHKDDEGKTHVNIEATQAAQDKADEIRQEFEDWVFKDTKQRETLVDFYNDNLNTTIETVWDGSYLTLPGKVPDAVIKLRRHQLNAVARGIRTGLILFDHVVGSGKTFTIIAMLMELRRLGISKKPMIAVPNHLVEQWAIAFYQLYPGAKILAMRKADFTKQNRQRMLAKVATGDWDAVIFSHSSFGFIENDRDVVATAMQNQIAEMQHAVDLARETEGKKSRTAANYQKSLERMKEKLKGLLDKPKDKLLTFQELGVDMLTTDESQEFKNLFFTTQRRGVGGFGNPNGSKRAMDMFIKGQWLQKVNNGRGFAFATGTPVSNSLTEIFTLLRYMAMDQLAERGMTSLDAWLAAFGITAVEYESNVTGTKYKRKERLRRITNAPELMQMYKSFTDSVTQEDVKRNFREDNDGAEFPIPGVKGGKPTNVVVPRSARQAAIFADLQERMDHLPSDPRIDNALAVLSDGRKAALDVRLLNPEAGDEPGSKVHEAADNIYRIYTANTYRSGTQLVFLDLSTPNKHGKKDAAKFLKDARALLGQANAAPFGDLRSQWKELRGMLQDKMDHMEEEAGGASIDAIEKFLEQDSEIMAAVTAADTGFSVYDDLRTKLIDRGVSPGEIAFIHDFNGDTKKQELFDMVNGGRMRVLLGSTAKMGAGTNVQRKLTALHHLDCPWRPSDIEQRDGRGIRQGNEFRMADLGYEIEILRYATEATSDVFFWQTQEQKLMGINSLRNFKGEREIDDVSADSMSAAEMKALASGNPLILEDVQLTEQIRKLEAQRRRHISTEQDLQSEVQRYERQIEHLPPVIARQEKTVEKINAYREDPFEGKRPTADMDGTPMNASEARNHIRDVKQLADDAAYEANREARLRLAEIAELSSTKIPGSDAFAALETEHATLNKALVKPKFHLVFDGKEYNGEESARKAVVDVLGDPDPVRMVIRDEDVIRRGDIKFKIDALIHDLKVKDLGKATLGTIGGMPVELEWVDDKHGSGVNVTLGGETELVETRHVLTGKKLGDTVIAFPTGERIWDRISSMLRDIPDTLESNQRRLSTAEKGLGPLKEQLGKPWGKDLELASKKARVEEVRKLLASDGDQTASPGAKYSLEQPAGWEVGNDVVDSRVADVVRGILEHIAPKANVRVVDTYFGAGPSVVASGAPSEAKVKVAGSYLAAGQLITVALSSPNTVRTAKHEAIHALKDMGLFTPAEWTVLEREAEARWKAQYKVPDLEEAIAYAFSDHKAGDTAGLVGKAFQRVRDFLERLGNALRGLGFQTASDVFKKIGTGAVGGSVRKGSEADLASMDLEAYRAMPESFRQAVRDDLDAVLGKFALGDKNYTHEIVDTKTGNAVPGKQYQSREAASRGADKMDNDYGAYRYRARPIEGAKVEEKFSLGTDLPDNIAVIQKQSSEDINPLKRFFWNPRNAFKDHPTLSALQQFATDIETSIARTARNLTDEYNEIRGRFKKDKAKWETLTDALWVGDADGHEFTDEELRNDLGWTDANLIKAYHDFRSFVLKMGRLVDMHRRSMLPKYRQRKEAVLNHMRSLTVMDDAEFRSLYGKRSRLRAKLRAGTAPEAETMRTLVDIERQMQGIREETEEYEDFITELDRLDGILAETSIRKREGYVPHKFFGTYAVYRLVEEPVLDSDGQPTLNTDTGQPMTETVHKLVAGEHGFYPTQRDAVQAAKRVAALAPDGQFVVQPVQFKFPNSAATTLTDASYWALMGNAGKAMGLSGQDLRDAMDGVARRRFRRRIAGFAQFRQGIEGFSDDMDRVMRSHTNEVARYVFLDKLKYRAINDMESMGMSPFRSANQKNPTLTRMVEAFLRDMNGQKQGMEISVDDWLDKLLSTSWGKPVLVGIPASFAGAGLLFGISTNPIVAAAVSSYVGYRLYSSLSKGGEFKARRLTQDMMSDMAHAKLGAIFNLGSAIVNLSQTIVNTLPVLGPQYTLTGMVKLEEALRSKIMGEPNEDYRLLERSDTISNDTYTETQLLEVAQHSLARWSLFFFRTTENFNRAVSFLGAYHRAKDRGDKPGPAFKEAEAAMGFTQHHYGPSNKAEALRNVFLRVPLQFKNYMMQQIAFTFELGRKGKTGKSIYDEHLEIPREAILTHLASLFLVSGAIGLPFTAILSLLIKGLTDWDPLDEVKKAALEAQSRSKLAAGAWLTMVRGLPAWALGEDMSARAGMGEQFTPQKKEDLYGPWWGTMDKAIALGELQAGFVDQLAGVSPGAGKPLKAIEAMANGMPIWTAATDTKAFYEALGDNKINWVSPWKNRPEFDESILSKADVARMAVGSTPTKVAMARDEVKSIEAAKTLERKKSQLWVNKIVSADRTYGHDQKQLDAALDKIQRDMQAAGVEVKESTIKKALADAQRPRLERTIRGAPTKMRGPAADRAAPLMQEATK